MPKKILIIDDEIHILTYLRHVLEDNGYQTATASNGEEGYEVMQREKPDLITLDLQMPKEGGTKFYQKFRKDEDYKHIPIIVVTGQDSPHRSLKPEKVVAIVAKPFEPEDLVRLVQGAIGQP
jgi:CheY-like chemotaxis protein